MELENIILSERQLSYVLTHKWFKQKAKKSSLQIIIPENLDKNEDPKRDIHGSNMHEKKKKKRSP